MKQNKAHLEQSLNALEHHKHFYQEMLSELVAIPSVSFPGYPETEVLRCAELVQNKMQSVGLVNVQSLTKQGHPPYLFGETPPQAAKPTILLYAHYDVQPPMREELWDSPPYIATERNGRLYGRGAADDKAGVVLHLASIHALLQTIPHESELPVNIKVLFEGEEEVSSPGLEEFIQQHKELLQADALIVADAANYDTGYPALTTSLRGMVAIEVELKALQAPLHSGLWGGPLPDPAAALVRLLAGLYTDDEQGRQKIAVPELYSMIAPVPEAERASWNDLGMSEDLLRKQSGLLDSVPAAVPEEEILESLWRQPALTISAIQSGDRKTAGNVLMDSAWARIGLRLAPGMQAQKSLELLKTKIQELASKLTQQMEIHITPEGGSAEAWSTDTEHPIFQAALSSLSEAFVHPAACIGCGATIPFVESLCESLGGIPALLSGVEDPYSKAHSENESLHLGDWYKLMDAQIRLFFKMTEVSE
jgi:acetylornithine deacetylase/succinyl-diaminopimelate desuccinylase-like protein